MSIWPLTRPKCGRTPQKQRLKEIVGALAPFFVLGASFWCWIANLGTVCRSRIFVHNNVDLAPDEAHTDAPAHKHESRQENKKNLRDWCQVFAFWPCFATELRFLATDLRRSRVFDPISASLAPNGWGKPKKRAKRRKIVKFAFLAPISAQIRAQNVNLGPKTALWRALGSFFCESFAKLTFFGNGP